MMIGSAYFLTFILCLLFYAGFLFVDYMPDRIFVEPIRNKLD